MVETVRDLAKGARVVVHFEARIKMQGNRAKVAKGERNSLDLKCGNDQPVTTDRVSPKVVRVLVKTTAKNDVLYPIATEGTTQGALINVLLESGSRAQS